MKKKIIRLGLGCFVLVILLMLVAYCFPGSILTVDSGAVRADAIIVLGGGSHERPMRAAELFKKQAAPTVIVTGEGDDEINRRLLVENGVPSSAIQVEGKSQTTRENALFTIKLMRAKKIHSAILVTSWYHSRRALKTFEHFAPDLKFYSRPSYFAFARKDWTPVIRKYIYWEYAKLPGYWVCYGVWPF